VNYILFILIAFYQEIPDYKYEIVLHDSTVYVDIGYQTFILEDKDGTYSIEEVAQSNYQDRFIKSEQHILTFPPSDSYYWVKFNIRSTTEKKFLVFIDEAKFNSIDLYYKVGDREGWKVLRNGYSVPQNQKAIAHNFQVFPINLSGGTTGEYYLRMQPQLMPVPISIQSEDYFFQIKNSQYNLILGLLVGIVFFIGLNNLAQYFSSGGQMRLLYFFIAISFALYSILFNGQIFLIAPFIYKNLVRFVMPLTFINQILVIIYGIKFLQVRKHIKWLYRWSISFIVALVFLTILSLFVSEFYVLMIFINMTGILSLGSCLLMGILSWRGNDSIYKPTILIYTCSYILFLAFLILEIGHIYFGWDYFLIVRFLDIGFLCEATGLAIALSVQTGIDKKQLEESRNKAQAENIQLISNQNQILEERVNQRTFELQETTKIAEQLSTEYKLQSEQLKEVNLVKDRLFSIISHDLRSPLRQLQGVLNLAGKNQLSEDELKTLLHQVNINLGINIQLTDNLLFWARTQMAGAQVNNQTFELSDLVEKKYLFFNHSMDAKNIQAKNGVQKDLRIYSDENIIALVIHNLLANAIKFCNHGDSIVIGCVSKESEVVIYVSDTGVGMTASDMQNILDNTIFTKHGTANEKGTGLGLKICKDLIRQIDGKLWIESQPGIGTTFYFSVPTKSEFSIPKNQDAQVN